MWPWKVRKKAKPIWHWVRFLHETNVEPSASCKAWPHGRGVARVTGCFGPASYADAFRIRTITIGWIHKQRPVQSGEIKIIIHDQVTKWSSVAVKLFPKMPTTFEWFGEQTTGCCLWPAARVKQGPSLKLVAHPAHPGGKARWATWQWE